MRMRMSIYVPEALHARIQTYGEDVNWSEVAQQAFEQKLGELAAAKIKKDMKDTIDRLRASKAKAQGAHANAAKAVAEVWCKDKAEYDQIKRVAEIRESYGMDFDKVDWDHESLGKCIAEAAFGQDLSWDEISSFWESVSPSGSTLDLSKVDKAFCYGFLDAVETFFAEVEAQL